jgi:hypothetical protein
VVVVPEAAGPPAQLAVPRQAAAANSSAQEFRRRRPGGTLGIRQERDDVKASATTAAEIPARRALIHQRVR